MKDTLFDSWWYTPDPVTMKSMFDLYGNPTGLFVLAFMAGRTAQLKIDISKIVHAASEKREIEIVKEDERPICSADGCSRREPCGPYCKDEGNFK